MTFYESLSGAALDAYIKGYVELKNRAMNQGHMSDAELVIRPLRMEDLAATPNGSADYNIGITANTFTSLVNQTLDTDRWIMIAGVSNQSLYSGTSVGLGTTPVVEEIQIQRKGATARYWPVTQIAYFLSKQGWADDPVIVDPNTNITVQLWSRTAGSLGSNLQLLGLTAERRGKTINP